MAGKTLLQRLDDTVRWTGIPRLVLQQPLRRPLRWPSTLSLLLAGSGFATMLAAGFDGLACWFGYALLMIGFGISTFMAIFGPLKPYGSLFERADERDRAVRARSYLATFAAFAVLTFAGLALLLIGVAVGWRAGIMAQALLALGFLLLTVVASLPTAHASWTVRWDGMPEQDSAGATAR